MRANEQHWRLPSSPIVRKKHRDFLCKFKSVLSYMRIAKPFVLPLHFFVTITNNTTCSQNSRNNRRIRRRLPAPEFANSGKQTVVSLCKFKSVLIYTWIAKPFILPLQMFASITKNTTCSQDSRNNRRI